MYTTGEALSAGQIQRMLVLQDNLNSVIDPDWVAKDNDYYLAIMMETAEAIEHLGWKWWKKQDSNMEQVRLEIIDVWHFILCQFICDYGIERAANEIKTCLDKGRSNAYFNSWTLKEMLVDTMREATLVGADEIAIAYDPLLQKAGMTWQGLYRQYMLKNTLNIFRQDNGYKDGEYDKIWNGKEDNEYLGNISPSAETMEEIYGELEYIYLMANRVSSKD